MVIFLPCPLTSESKAVKANKTKSHVKRVGLKNEIDNVLKTDVMVDRV
jgi:hypothetical protein